MGVAPELGSSKAVVGRAPCGNDSMQLLETRLQRTNNDDDAHHKLLQTHRIKRAMHHLRSLK